ncbi:hypothetical protein HY386_00170 [Candidatus Daviesbacteria bacterium]|nr:hypothetical protein [Candidatus Daviesbacteria bacterium]
MWLPEQSAITPLSWGQKELKLMEIGNLRIILPTSEEWPTPGLYVLPDSAEMRVRKNEGTSRINPNLTHYLEQTPPVHAIRQFRGVSPLVHELFYGLLGREAHIYDDGNFNPQQLPDIARFCLERFNWDITTEARNLLRL